MESNLVKKIVFSIVLLNVKTSIFCQFRNDNKELNVSDVTGIFEDRYSETFLTLFSNFKFVVDGGALTFTDSHRWVKSEGGGYEKGPNRKIYRKLVNRNAITPKNVVPLS